MSRLGVPESVIHRACAQLAEKGINVTVDAVRDRVGGSNSTLAPVVRAWKEENRRVVGTETNDLPADLVQCVRDVHKRTQAHATLRIEEAQERAAVQIQAAQKSVEDGAKREMHLAEENARLADKIALLGNKIDVQDVALTSSKIRIAELETMLSQQAKNLTDREEEIKDARKAFEQLQQRCSEQLRDLRIEAAQKLDQVSADALQLRTDNARLDVQVKTLQSHNVELRNAVENSRKDNEKINADLARAVMQKSRLEADLSDMLAARKTDHAQSREVTNQLDEVRMALSAKEAEARILQRDLSRLQSLHDKLNQDAVIWRQDRQQMEEMIRRYAERDPD